MQGSMLTVGQQSPLKADLRQNQNDKSVRTHHSRCFCIAKDPSFRISLHRFSISWNRIVPQGFANTPVNQEGVQFYNDMINDMMANGITPYVTIYHWDLPQVGGGGGGGGCWSMGRSVAG